MPYRAVAVVTNYDALHAVVATVRRVRAAAPPPTPRLSLPPRRTTGPPHSVHVHSSLCIWYAPCHPVRGYTPRHCASSLSHSRHPYVGSILAGLACSWRFWAALAPRPTCRQACRRFRRRSHRPMRLPTRRSSTLLVGNAKTSCMGVQSYESQALLQETGASSCHGTTFCPPLIRRHLGTMHAKPSATKMRGVSLSDQP